MNYETMMCKTNCLSSTLYIFLGNMSTSASGEGRVWLGHVVEEKGIGFLKSGLIISDVHTLRDSRLHLRLMSILQTQPSVELE